MIFSEVYGNYFNAVAAILEKAVNGDLTGKGLSSAVMENAFGESLMTIPAKLTDGSWPLLEKDGSTTIDFAPSMPLTDLQRQWLKALLLDPRIQLFAPSEEGLEDVEPLFTPDMFVYFDRYSNGDPFGDEEYIRNFRTLLSAIKDKRWVRVCFESGKGTRQTRVCLPRRLEYSSKDDRFRVICVGRGGRAETVNLGRIISSAVLEAPPQEKVPPLLFNRETLTVELYDERNALERCMLHFSDLEKETEKLDDRHYRIRLHYLKEDETEILIRILSFGKVLKVIEPESFADLIRVRLQMQTGLMDKLDK